MILGTIVLGKPIVKTYQAFIDESIELCEKLEDNNSEEKEIEDDIEKQHFLKRRLDVPIIFYTAYNRFCFKENKLLTLFKSPLLQPPRV